MAKLTDNQINRRIKDPQLRTIVKTYFGNDEYAVRGIEAAEKRMEEIVKKLEKKISDGFANTATKSDVENIRNWIDVIVKAQSGKKPTPDE